MRNTLELSADKLRIQGIVVCTASLLAASALPVVSYIYVFQHAAPELGPFAWTHWAIVGAACLLGMFAHALNHKAILALHVAFCTMLGAALGGLDTAFWYQLSTRCQTVQAAFVGCQQCACAATNTCATANFLSDALCQSCTAYPTEVCNPALQTNQKFVIAFTGLTAVLFLALPAFFSLLVLCRVEAAAAVTAARRNMVSFSVDQQTAMVESNEKPVVTPAMLAAWVSYLLSTHDPDCVAVAKQCQTVLSGCGFELDVKTSADDANKKGKGKAGAGKRGKKKQLMADSSMSSMAGPGADAYAAAESGGTSVTAPANQRVQFVVQH